MTLKVSVDTRTVLTTRLTVYQHVRDLVVELPAADGLRHRLRRRTDLHRRTLPPRLT
jgi:hypothetical protein